ncbi:unnamed protein product [Lactuca virosa]|uniref:Uncharacterized protein n=1 Tax=Lactuca virosa TaxID=75947 RepID=A0AAU9NHY0_9ASTR|nr:unnamed protein product [Lactuca virosa]
MRYRIFQWTHGLMLSSMAKGVGLVHDVLGWLGILRMHKLSVKWTHWHCCCEGALCISNGFNVRLKQLFSRPLLIIILCFSHSHTINLHSPSHTPNPLPRHTGFLSHLPLLYPILHHQIQFLNPPSFSSRDINYR